MATTPVEQPTDLEHPAPPCGSCVRLCWEAGAGVGGRGWRQGYGDEPWWGPDISGWGKKVEIQG